MFDDIKVPDDMKGDVSQPNTIAQGPFVMTHNGILSLAANLAEVGDGTLTVADTSRVYVIDDTYDVSYGDDDESITFESTVYSSTFSLRAVQLTDAEVFLPGESYTDLKFLRDDALDIVSMGHMY